MGRPVIFRRFGLGPDASRFLKSAKKLKVALAVTSKVQPLEESTVIHHGPVTLGEKVISTKESSRKLISTFKFEFATLVELKIST